MVEISGLFQFCTLMLKAVCSNVLSTLVWGNTKISGKKYIQGRSETLMTLTADVCDAFASHHLFMGRVQEVLTHRRP